MNLQVTDEAALWYKSEMNLHSGDCIRFFVRYGGCSTVQSGFSLGVEKTDPVDIGVETVSEGITFFIEQKDLWYFDNHDLNISLNKLYNEPAFDYVQN